MEVNCKIGIELYKWQKNFEKMKIMSEKREKHVSSWGREG